MGKTIDAAVAVGIAKRVAPFAFDFTTKDTKIFRGDANAGMTKTRSRPI